jgi:ubiquinone biosynthesis monooxygenase Coq7
MTRRPRPAPPGVSTEDEIAAMIRVDHAGEYGAVRIYQGQLAVLGRKKTRTAEAIRHMARQEEGHLRVFDDLVYRRRVRPTALAPVWHVAGLALGAATALLGEKAAMACTEAVEDVIDRHYAGQVERLGERDPELKAAIEKFRADEVVHRDTATAHGAAEAPAYRFLSGFIKTGCRLAIALSTRI